MIRNINLFLKRIVDILVSLSGTVFCLPIWIVIIIFIKVTMPGPIFFKQERIGKNFKPFSILKFRSMRVDKYAEENHIFSKDKERVTTVGKFLRRSKLDETPQLLNVLLGDMSLIGPRPTIKEKVEQYPNNQSIRLSVRPGMTGISQIRGNVLLSWERRIEYDCEYVKRFNIFLDFWILFKTCQVVFCGEESMINEYDLKYHKNHNYNGRKW